MSDFPGPGNRGPRGNNQMAPRPQSRLYNTIPNMGSENDCHNIYPVDRSRNPNQTNITYQHQGMANRALHQQYLRASREPVANQQGYYPNQGIHGGQAEFYNGHVIGQFEWNGPNQNHFQPNILDQHEQHEYAPQRHGAEDWLRSENNDHDQAETQEKHENDMESFSNWEAEEGDFNVPNIDMGQCSYQQTFLPISSPFDPLTGAQTMNGYGGNLHTWRNNPQPQVNETEAQPWHANVNHDLMNNPYWQEQETFEASNNGVGPQTAPHWQNTGCTQDGQLHRPQAQVPMQAQTSMQAQMPMQFEATMQGQAQLQAQARTQAQMPVQGQTTMHGQLPMHVDASMHNQVPRYAQVPAQIQASTQDYLEMEEQPPEPKRNNGRANWDEPVGSIPESLLYIWPDRARQFARSQITLPGQIDCQQLNNRKCAELRGAFSLGTIITNVRNAPPVQFQQRAPAKTIPKKARTADDTLKNRISKRNQVWRTENGIFCDSSCATDKGQVQKVYRNRLVKLSDAQLFHGVIGKIDPNTFTMIPPLDRCHIDNESNQLVRYELPPPIDIPLSARQELQKLGRVFPTILEFKRRNPRTYWRYFPEEFQNDKEMAGIDLATLFPQVVNQGHQMQWAQPGQQVHPTEHAYPTEQAHLMEETYPVEQVHPMEQVYQTEKAHHPSQQQPVLEKRKRRAIEDSDNTQNETPPASSQSKKPRLEREYSLPDWAREFCARTPASLLFAKLIPEEAKSPQKHDPRKIRAMRKPLAKTNGQAASREEQSHRNVNSGENGSKASLDNVKGSADGAHPPFEPSVLKALFGLIKTSHESRSELDVLPQASHEKGATSQPEAENAPSGTMETSIADQEQVGHTSPTATTSQDDTLDENSNVFDPSSLSQYELNKVAGMASVPDIQDELMPNSPDLSLYGLDLFPDSSENTDSLFDDMGDLDFEVPEEDPQNTGSMFDDMGDLNFEVPEGHEWWK